MPLSDDTFDAYIGRLIDTQSVQSALDVTSAATASMLWVRDNGFEYTATNVIALAGLMLARSAR